jgi:hypothetical protein
VTKAMSGNVEDCLAPRRVLQVEGKRRFSERESAPSPKW